MALQSTLFTHDILHDWRSKPDGIENTNTSPAALSQIVSMPSFTHGPEFGAVVSLVVATVLVVVVYCVVVVVGSVVVSCAGRTNVYAVDMPFQVVKLHDVL